MTLIGKHREFASLQLFPKRREGSRVFFFKIRYRYRIGSRSYSAITPTKVHSAKKFTF